MKKYDESIIFVIQKRTFLNSRKSNQRMIVADCVSELYELKGNMLAKKEDLVKGAKELNKKG